ncbi:MAG: nitrile hydratase accessory protein [Acidobacteria bacterium]|nr:nitrile hydratase accessory protein [Acidobacteriota bacterium]
MTTSSALDLLACGAELWELPRDEDGPVFAEPWQAQAFALAVRLSSQGHFTWREWADHLAAELAAAVDRGEADDGSEYYHHWVAALEKLVMAKRLAGEPELYERKEAWADAYRHTPHGQPVQLRPGFRIRYQYRHSPLLQVTRVDGATKTIRVQDGHLFVCSGCCCGRTEKGFPALPLEEFKQQWKRRGFRRRFHLTVSGCLGPCPLANVVLLQFRGRSMWFHSINRAEDVNLIYDWVERALQEESDLDVPAELASRQFQRYLDTGNGEESAAH